VRVRIPSAIKDVQVGRTTGEVGAPPAARRISAEKVPRNVAACWGWPCICNGSAGQGSQHGFVEACERPTKRTVASGRTGRTSALGSRLGAAWRSRFIAADRFSISRRRCVGSNQLRMVCIPFERPNNVNRIRSEQRHAIYGYVCWCRTYDVAQWEAKLVERALHEGQAVRPQRLER